jgi:uracil-DNA glycosylase family 4
LNEYQRLDEELLACRKCESLLAAKPVDPLKSTETVKPRAIVTGIRPKPIMLIGQAPGMTEYQTGKPFQGDAGQGIRGVLAECGLPAGKFADLVYTSAVVKCFPGSKKVANRRRPGFRREDELPSRSMVDNCRPFFERQIALANPKLVLLLGAFALKAYLRLRNHSSEDLKLENFVGRVEEWGQRTVMVLPHTSGTSRWFNDPSNKELFAKAKGLLRREIAMALGRVGA